MPHQPESIQAMIHSRRLLGFSVDGEKKRNWLYITNITRRAPRIFFLRALALVSEKIRKSHSFDFINLLKQKIEFLWMR